MNLVVKELWIYPIKSLGGINIKLAWVHEKGMELDRRWMLINSQDQFLTQRNFSIMAEFKLELFNSMLKVKFRSFYFILDINKNEDDFGTIDANIWNSMVK